jgi:antitoxin HicB
MSPDRYPLQVFWSEEDEGYIATVPDLPGCSAFGETSVEAVNEAGAAISTWIVAARAAGNAIPQPSRPAALPSGRVLLRLPKSLHASLIAGAAQEGTSLNQYAVYLLSRAQEAEHVEWQRTSYTAHLNWQRETVSTIATRPVKSPIVRIANMGGETYVLAG